MRISFLLFVFMLLSPAPGFSGEAHPSLPPYGSLDGLGINIHFTDPKKGELEMIAAAGFKWVRSDMDWSSIERTKGEYNFEIYDRLVAALTEHKLRAVFILDFGHPQYADPQDQFPYTSRAHSAEFREAYARWVVAVVKHYAGKGFLWEIWNEPNIATFWKPKPSTADYIALAETTGKALRDAGLCATNHSGEGVVGPACSLIDFAFLEECFKAGLLKYWCAVTVHPYRKQQPENVVEDYRRLRQLIAAYSGPGENIPICCGEWGYSTAATPNITEAKQAVYLARQALTNIANNVPLTIWYDWRDDGDKETYDQHRFGIVRRPYKEGANPPFEPKPAYLAARALTQQLGGFSFNKEVHLPALNADSNCPIDLFSHGEEVRMAAWRQTPGEKETVLPVSDCILRRVTALGGAGPEQKITSGPGKVLLDDSPSYFTTKAPDELLLTAAKWQSAPLEVPCEAPNRAPLPLTFVNLFSHPLLAKGWPNPLPPRATAQTSSDAIAPARMPLDELGETDAQFRGRHAYLDLLAPRCLLVQNFVAVVRNCVNVRVLPPGDKFLLLEVENHSAAKWQAQAHFFEAGKTETELPHTISLPAAAPTQYIRLPVRQLSPKPGVQLQIVETGMGRLTLPIPVRMAWNPDLQVDAHGDPEVPSEQSVARAAPPEGGPASETASFRLAYKFAAGWKFLRVASIHDLSPIEGKPDKIGMWIYGDGQGCVLRARFRDVSKQIYQLRGVKIQWKGWRYVTDSISEPELEHWGGANDGVIHYPITWESLLLDGVSWPVAGELYFSGPVLIYGSAGGSSRLARP